MLPRLPCYLRHGYAACVLMMPLAYTMPCRRLRRLMHARLRFAFIDARYMFTAHDTLPSACFQRV